MSPVFLLATGGLLDIAAAICPLVNKSPKANKADMADLVTYELDGEVARIGLNRPDKRNALNEQMVDHLEAAVDRASREAKAAVVFGHGKHFCAGLDLAEHKERSLTEAVHNSRRWHFAFDRMQRGSIPFFAALHGAAVGGGLELAATAHVRVADETAFFALPEGQRGIFLGGGGSVRIARLIGTANVTDMMLTGRVLDVAGGERVGAVQYRTAAGGALERATELAHRAAQNASLSNYAVINALPRIQDMSQDDGLFTESLISSITTASPEALERLRAFLEGRAERLMPPSDGAS